MPQFHSEPSPWQTILHSDRAEFLLNDAFRTVAQKVSAFLDMTLVPEPVAIRTLTLDMLWEQHEQIEAEYTGVYLLAKSPVTAHCLLVLNPATTTYVLTQLLGAQASEEKTFDETTLSALGELGNITITTLLNTLAEHIGIAMYPTPPVIMVDMLGAILNVIAVSVGAAETSFPVLQTTLVEQQRALAIQVWVFPE
ncbi:MAG: hypothetical protein D6802_02220 [Ardenticatenia bacterium]|nr:MAG: hypothetical protein D6802_02220 [Ardenticatenia bacterium]